MDLLGSGGGVLPARMVGGGGGCNMAVEVGLCFISDVDGLAGRLGFDPFIFLMPRFAFLPIMIFMNLKEAREKRKMEQFIREREKQPPAEKKRFNKLIKSLASQTAKPKRGTSRKGSRAG